MNSIHEKDPNKAMRDEVFLLAKCTQFGYFSIFFSTFFLIDFIFL